MCKNLQRLKYHNYYARKLLAVLCVIVPLVICENANENDLQMESPKLSWPDPNRDRDRRQVGLGSLSHDGSHSGDHGDQRSDSISVSDGSRSSISSPSRNKDELGPRRQYPNRDYGSSYGQKSELRQAQQFNDPASAFRQQSRQSQSRQNLGGTFPYDPYGPNRGNSSNSNRGRNINQTNKKSLVTTNRPAQLKKGKTDSPKDPFTDPDRYRVPQLEQAADNVRFVNGRPYR